MDESNRWNFSHMSFTLSFRYGVTILFVAATLALHLMLRPIVGDHAPFLFFFFPILFSAWLFGRGPGFLATGVSVLLIESVVIASAGLSFPAILLQLFFVASGLIISVLAAAKRKAEQKLLRLNRELDLRIAERTRELEAEIQHTRAKELMLLRQAQLLQLTHDAMIVRSFRTARILFWNKGAEKLYGWTESEALGKTSHELLQTKFSEPREHIEATVSKTGHWEGELVQTRADRSQVVVASRWFLRPAAQGEPAAFLEINSDLTEKKQAEEAPREKDRLASIGTAAAVFAHEVGNPLNGLSSVLQMLRRTETAPQASVLLEQAMEELRRLELLLQEFRDLVRPQSLHKSTTDVYKIIEEIVALQRSLCDAAGITLQVELQPLPNLLLDSGKLRQAILNVFKNAVEAMPQGGRLTVKAYSSDKSVYLEIGDTGPGVPEGARVFDLFVTTKPDGTGLGLPIVREIISAHDGTVSYSSEPGRGTTFKIALPVPSEVRRPLPGNAVMAAAEG